MTSALSLPSPAFLPLYPVPQSCQRSLKLKELGLASLQPECGFYTQFHSSGHTEALQVVTGGLRFTLYVYVCHGHVRCPQRPVGGTVPWNLN